MDTPYKPNDLGIPERMRPAQGRPVRSRTLGVRLSPAEEEQVKRVATAEGMHTTEWAREVLLEKARSGSTGTAVFTELIALRMLVSNVLRPLALGENITREAYAQILAEVKGSKHDAAKDVLTQYQNPTGGK